MTTIHLASDHAGFDLKNLLKTALKNKGLEVEDYGTETSESCDYPVFAQSVAEAIQKSPNDVGILVCGTGLGMSIAANKFKGIRAAAVSEEKSAALAREHNNAQILCLGARVIDFGRAMKCVDAFLSAKFDVQNPRHQRRIDLISQFEA